MASRIRTLSTADDRRADVISAATTAFARRGYFGTNTTEVAQDAGISQAYLYRLYDNKEALFVAVLAAARQRIHDELRRTLDGTRSKDVDEALLKQGVSDPDTAMVLLHAVAACIVPAIATAVQDCYEDQLVFLRSRGAAAEAVRRYLADAQYANTLRAAGVDSSSPAHELIP